MTEVTRLGKPFVGRVRKVIHLVKAFRLLLVKCYDIKMVELILRGVNFHLASQGQQTNKK